MQKCPFCSHKLIAGKPLVYVTQSQSVFHQGCFHFIFRGTVPGVLLENLKERAVVLKDTKGIKRLVYMVSIAVCVLAFGIFSAMSKIVILSVVAISSGALIVRGIDHYAYSHATRKACFQ